MTRNAYYEHQYRKEQRQALEILILEIVRSIRKHLPRLGGKKLWRMVNKELRAHDFKNVGRDKLFALLREQDLLVDRRKAQVPRTTYSGHDYAIQPNLFKDFKLTAPCQVLVTDITYLRVEHGFAYLFLVTDAYTRKILGYHLAQTLSHTGAVAALRMAARQLPNPVGVIHHSDRGVQYCCHEFLNELRVLQMRSSMTDADHCAQNALAERMNGILKNEFFLDLHFLHFEDAVHAVDQAVLLYNEMRPHGSLNMQTPEEFHRLALAA